MQIETCDAPTCLWPSVTHSVGCADVFGVVVLEGVAAIPTYRLWQKDFFLSCVFYFLFFPRLISHAFDLSLLMLYHLFAV